MLLKNQVALEPSELEVGTTQQQDTGAGRLLSPLRQGGQAHGCPLADLSMGRASSCGWAAAWLGQLGWVRALGRLWISPSIYFTFLGEEP